MAEPSFFELNNIDSFVQKEFKRRSNDIGFNYQTDTKSLPPNNYKGPRSAWVRVCSNTVDPDSGLHGFIMGGVNGFDDTYGFNSVMRRNPMLPSDKNNNSYTTGPATILGYDVYGSPHAIEESSFKHRPCPGVTGLDMELMGGAGKFRKTTIKWQCWSPEQLAYLENYFLIPTVSIFVEWGWNCFNPTSLLDLTDDNGLKDLIKNDSAIQEKVKASDGNWDMSYGIITDFNYDLREDGGYDVSTTISNPSSLYTAFSIKDNIVEQNGEVKITPKDYVEKLFSNLPNIVDHGWKSVFTKPEYGGEDRVFYFRENKDLKQKPANNFEVFGSNQKEFWVSFDLIVDIMNAFYSKIDAKDRSDGFKIDISDTIICAHANLKSTDSKVLLIPNIRAPSGEVLSEAEMRGSKNMSPENRLLYLARRSTKRENLEKIICRSRNRKVIEDRYLKKLGVSSRDDLAKDFNWKRYNAELDISFPNYSLDEYGNAGFLKHLYVNSEIVRNAISTNEFIHSALKQMLDEISAAACGIWNFDSPIARNTQGQCSVITVKDKNYIGNKTVKQFINDPDSYSFNLITSDSFVKNAKFNVKPSSNVTMQALLSNDSVEVNTTSPKTWMEFRNKDRIQGPFKQADVAMPSKPIYDPQKQKLSLSPVDPRYAIMRFPIQAKDIFGQPISNFTDIRLCEPDAALQKSIMDDKNPKNNAAYNAIMPNTTLDITIRGIAGLRFLDCFTVSSGLPPTYSKKNVLFQITNVKHSLSGGDWYTTINAGVRPKPSFDK